MDPNQVVPDMQKLTINFVDTTGKALRAPENVTVAFDFTSELKKAVLPIAGYELARTDATKPGEFTYIYQKKVPAENGGGTAVTTPPTTVTHASGPQRRLIRSKSCLRAGGVGV